MSRGLRAMRAWLTAAVACLTFVGPVLAADVVEYYHTDGIGNVRAVTNQAGQVIERHDYLPFGEECTTGACATNPGLGAGQPRKFTGKERDAETGLDYFGARYYGSKIGRFTTTDPVYNWNENLLDPQRWNRYAYGRNNPFRYVDPDGRDPKDIAKGVGKGVVFGAVDVGLGLFGLLDNPESIVTGPIEAVAVAGQAYFTSAGRAQLGAQFGALDQEGKTSLITEAITLGGIGAALGKVGRAAPEADVASVGPKPGSVGGPGAGKAFSQATKDAARAESSDTCVFCGRQTSSQRGPAQSNIDHAYPKSRGGNNTFDNAQNTCRTCNLQKGARTTQEFRQQ